MDATVTPDEIPTEKPALTGRARSLANIRPGPIIPRQTRDAATVYAKVTADLRRLLGTVSQGKTWSERVALGLLKSASKGNAQCATLILDRVEGPIAGVQGKGNLTINVQGTVNIGAPVNALPELPAAADDPDPTRP